MTYFILSVQKKNFDKGVLAYILNNLYIIKYSKESNILINAIFNLNINLILVLNIYVFLFNI